MTRLRPVTLDDVPTLDLSWRDEAAAGEFLWLGYRATRVEAGTETGNLAERRALEKAGFAREGVLRHAGFRDGRWRDGVLYSKLRGEA